jgi:hypothetical protein
MEIAEAFDELVSAKKTDTNILIDIGALFTADSNVTTQ